MAGCTASVYRTDVHTVPMPFPNAPFLPEPTRASAASPDLAAVMDPFGVLAFAIDTAERIQAVLAQVGLCSPKAEQD
jgi:hypothetical protein